MSLRDRTVRTIFIHGPMKVDASIQMRVSNLMCSLNTLSPTEALNAL